MNVLVLGAGLVGRPMVLDLAKERLFSVTVADVSKQSLDKIPNESTIKKVECDLSDTIKLQSLLKG